MTFGELKTETFRRLEESSSSPVFWSEDDVEDALNDGLRELSDETEWYEISRHVEVLKARPYYDVRDVFDVDVLTVTRAYHDDTNRWMVPSAATDLDRGYARWSQQIGMPERIIVRGQWWLSYWPYTGTEATTRVRQYATALPEPMDDDEDEPGCDPAFHDALIDYALADLLPQAGEVSLALEAWARYLAREAHLKDHVEGRGGVPGGYGYTE